jgi:hypothetical protein
MLRGRAQLSRLLQPADRECTQGKDRGKHSQERENLLYGHSRAQERTSEIRGENGAEFANA